LKGRGHCLIQILPRNFLENYEKRRSQDSRCPRQDSNHAPPQYESKATQTRSESGLMSSLSYMHRAQGTCTDVSEEHTASIFRVLFEKMGWLQAERVVACRYEGKILRVLTSNLKMEAAFSRKSRYLRTRLNGVRIQRTEISESKHSCITMTCCS
jgi:hypothetical protein